MTPATMYPVLHPDALIFISDDIGCIPLRQMRNSSGQTSTDAGLYRDSQQASIDAAVNAGVKAYIIGEITEQIISAAEVLV